MSYCYAIENAQFQPSMRIITAITKANPASVTTSFDHDYETGLIVRLYIPEYYGMPQINKKICSIIVTSSNTFTIDIDSTSFDAFVVPAPAWYQNTCSIVVPVTGIVQDATYL